MRLALGLMCLNTFSFGNTGYAVGATSSADQDRPLGILLSPNVINENSPSAEPVSVPEPTEPPLGTLLHPGTYVAPPSNQQPEITHPTPFTETSGDDVTSFPGYSQKIETPNASENRPLGVLFSAPPARTPTRQSNTTPFPSGASQPDARPEIAPVLWKADGQSEDRPLGALFAPDPVLQSAPSSGPANISPPLTSTRSVSAPPVAPKWSTGGQSQARPLGTLFAPDTPPAFVPEAAAPVPSPTNTTDETTTDASRPAANFSADEMSFNRETGVVTASGNVVIHHQNRNLTANVVSYNRNTGVIQAEGNVVLVEGSGETIYGDLVEISGDLKDGIIKNIGVILSDRSRIAGTGARRSDGLVTEMSKAVYSPCKLCAENPDHAPVWQIKAVRVTHDKSKQVVEYRDAWLEFFGYPVFYTPFFRHPDPTVKRKSGFLFPTVSTSSDLGTALKTPYFWNISPHEDATITPVVMTGAPPLLIAEYRKRLMTGEIDMSGSLTANSDDSDALSTEKGKYGLRGHLESEGRFDINNTWRWGFDANGTTDDTYLRRFGFSSPSSLDSRLFTEAFRQRSYFSASALTFQGLQSDDNQDEIPFVLPLVDFNHVGNRDRFGGITNLDFNFLALTREEGTDTRRLSVHTKWQRPVVGKFGDFYNVSVGINADLYHTNSLLLDSGEEYTGFSYRAIPEVALDWRMPFAKSEGPVSQILEPIAAFVWSPYGGNPDDIPNEDSIELEFDDTNLFSTNRYSGLDRVEAGPRLTYGLNWGIFGKGGGSTKVFAGQSWRPKEDSNYANGSGLESNFSDIVARVDIKPGNHLDLSYRTRFSPESFSPNRNEVKISTGIPAFKVNANYVFLDQQTESEFAGREELNYSISSTINRFWRAGFSGVRDMAANEFRTAGLSLVYEDECVTFTTNATRTFFEDRDIEPTDSITFRILLKTLGEVHSGLSLAQ